MLRQHLFFSCQCLAFPLLSSLLFSVLFFFLVCLLKDNRDQRLRHTFSLYRCGFIFIIDIEEQRKATKAVSIAVISCCTFFQSLFMTTECYFRMSKTPRSDERRAAFGNRIFFFLSLPFCELFCQLTGSCHRFFSRFFRLKFDFLFVHHRHWTKIKSKIDIWCPSSPIRNWAEKKEKYYDQINLSTECWTDFFLALLLYLKTDFFLSRLVLIRRDSKVFIDNK